MAGAHPGRPAAAALPAERADAAGPGRARAPAAAVGDGPGDAAGHAAAGDAERPDAARRQEGGPGASGLRGMMFTADEKLNLILALIGLSFCAIVWVICEIAKDERPSWAEERR